MNVSDQPLLVMSGISKSFPGVKALSGVSLCLRAGEVHALMGENGAGKSTLIKILTGLYPPDAGRIGLAGETICPRSPQQAESCGISTVYQEINLIPTLSVAENICLGRESMRWGGVNWQQNRARARAALARLGLTLDVKAPLGSFPLAIQQLVAIARALEIDARILVLDEPTSSLDEGEVAALFGVLRRLRDGGLAILMVTHFLDQVYAVSDRITVLRNGTFAGEYPTAELPRLCLIGKMLGRTMEAEAGAVPLAGAGEGGAGEIVMEVWQAGRRGGVQQLDLALHRGEVTGLAGLLGSGRTEAARMLFGIDPAETGRFAIEGTPVSLRSPRAAIAHGLAFCSEDRKKEGVIPHLPVRDNLMLAMQARRGLWRKLPAAGQKTLAEKYIRLLGIKTPGPETPIRNLSGGNQQKVLLARWLLMHPKVMILDEPTRGIDIGARSEIARLIASLGAQGMAVLLIASELEEVVENSHRVIVLRDRKPVGVLEGRNLTVPEVMKHIAQSPPAAA